MPLTRISPIIKMQRLAQHDTHRLKEVDLFTSLHLSPPSSPLSALFTSLRLSSEGPWCFANLADSQRQYCGFRVTKVKRYSTSSSPPTQLLEFGGDHHVRPGPGRDRGSARVASASSPGRHGGGRSELPPGPRRSEPRAEGGEGGSKRKKLRRSTRELQGGLHISHQIKYIQILE